ncbi:hypothetical protein PybrP1_002925 [[Pythium] brassicae (nom. inval.)]|nr:hypothetical protein PybrP1_002925 [[Pythium] brassicae (nom. inval.)]
MADVVAARTELPAPPHAAPTTATNDDDLPSVHELLRAVALLQGVVRDIGTPADDVLFEDDESPFTIYRSPSRGPRYYVDTRTQLASMPTLARGVSAPRPRGSSVLSEISPQKAGTYAAASGLVTPPPKRRDGVARSAAAGATSVPRPVTRVAALTRENISLLPAPIDLGRRRNAAGSISGASQQSRTSVRTDGGAVFSRLYQADYHRNRDQKLRAIRDRQEHLNLPHSPATNLSKRLSISSMDSAGSASTIGSMQSAKTDITGVSSRLYDPDYVRKRNARLARMREEREMRDCTFVPTINSAASVAAASAAAASAAAASRRASSVHLNYFKS